MFDICRFLINKYNFVHYYIHINYYNNIIITVFQIHKKTLKLTVKMYRVKLK